MKLLWTSHAVSDLDRLYDFLAPTNKQAAARVIQSLSHAPSKLVKHPRIGQQLEAFLPRDVRRLLIGHYELRYEIQGACIYLLRLWHTREDR